MEIALVPVADIDRTESGHIRPESYDRIRADVTRYLETVGYANSSELSRLLGVSRLTAKKLINEITAEWLDEESNQIATQLRWYEKKAEELEADPLKFGVKDEMSKVAAKNELFDRMNRLRLLQFGFTSKFGGRKEDAGVEYLAGRLKPRTLRLLQENNGNSTETAGR